MAEKIKVLRVVARTDSFRRAGFQFGADAKEIPMSEFASAAGKRWLAAIMEDPNLVASEVEVQADSVVANAPENVNPSAPDARGRARSTTRA